MGQDLTKEACAMFMRFVHLKVTEDTLWEVRRFYEDRVIPTLEVTEGCLFASLLQPTAELDECVSMTIWLSQEHAEAYESSGTYDRLLDESDDRLANTTEWKAKLKGNAKGGMQPPIYDPEVEGFQFELPEGTGVPEEREGRLFLRIVAARVEPDRFEAMRERYEAEIVPALLDTPGCQAAFIVPGIQARSRALSVSLWENEEAAVRYELSGKFEELTGRLSEYFSGLYQWRLSLDTADARRRASSDLEISGYHLVVGQRLES
jgi:heme-degrading monooxygenase HmoA